MGTTAQKLEYLGTTKSQLKTMINYGLDDNNKITSSTTFRNYVISLKEAFLEALRDTNTLFTNLPKKTGSGSNIALNDTAYAPMRLTLNSNTTQETTTGKNLLPNDLATKTVSGITITKNSDGTYKVNGTATADVSEAICNNFISMSGTWRMLGCPSGGSSSTYMLSAYVGYWGAGSPNIDTGSGTNITYTGNVKVRFYIKSGTTCNNLIFKPMLTTDTSTTTFEPYTYGASPNPNYPQEVVNVTGRQEIKAVGKNLADISKIAIGKSWSGVTSTQKATILWIPIKANQKYNFVSSWTNSSITNIRVVLNHGSNDQTNNLVVSSFPFTNTTWEYASVEVLANTTFTSDMLDGVKIMLCKGEDSEYEPYQEQVNEINLGKNLYNYPETEVNLVKSSTRTISITTNLPLTLQAGTYTISFPDLVMANNNYNLAVQPVGVTPVGSQLTNKSRTFTITEAKTLTSLYIYLNSNDNANATATFSKIQLEKSSSATSYSPYFTPIELCKIGNYEDKIFKNSGKNLFDEEIELGGINPADGTLVTNSSRTRSKNFIKVKPNTTYRITRQVGVYRWIVGYTSSKIGITDGNHSGQASALGSGGSATLTFTFTTSATTEYIKWYDTSNTDLTEQVMISEGSLNVDYEPYGSGEWYIKKAIGKIDLSTCTWTKQMDLTDNYKLFYTSSINNIKYASSNTQLIDNYSEKYIKSIASGMSGANKRNMLAIDTSAVRVQAIDEPTGLFYYPLTTPTYEKLNDELQVQIEKVCYGLYSYQNKTIINIASEYLPFIADVVAIEQ